MKKTIPIIGGTLLISAPIVISGVTVDNNPNLNHSIPSIKSDFFSYNDKINGGNVNTEACGIIGNVTYYGKRKGSKEVLDIFLDSQTTNQEDKCFLMVSVYSSDGELEYRLDTTIVYFTISTHYKIEIDPPKKENETYREVRVAATFYSNIDNHHQYLNFNIDYNDPTIYTFNNDLEYTSNYPIAMRYTLDGKVEKIYEKMIFENICNLQFKKPIFDINQFKLIYEYDSCEIMIPNYDECYLLIDDLYDESDMEEENEMKKIPLNLVYKNGLISFELLNNYYYDSSDGMLYQNNKSGRSEVTNLILPSTFSANEESIYYELHFKNFTSSGDEMIFTSYASFEIKWFGVCGEAYFCISSIDELLEDVYYSGGITI